MLSGDTRENLSPKRNISGRRGNKKKSEKISKFLLISDFSCILPVSQFFPENSLRQVHL